MRDLFLASKSIIIPMSISASTLSSAAKYNSWPTLRNQKMWSITGRQLYMNLAPKLICKEYITWGKWKPKRKIYKGVHMKNKKKFTTSEVNWITYTYYFSFNSHNPQAYRPWPTFYRWVKKDIKKFSQGHTIREWESRIQSQVCLDTDFHTLSYYSKLEQEAESCA